MLNFKFSHRSESHWGELRSRLEAASFTVRGGVFEGETEGGVPLADVAAFTELGTSSAPARPFISSAMRENRAEAAKRLQAVVKSVITGGSDTPQQLGEWMVEIIRRKMLSGPFAPLAPSTVQRKGHAQPLVDTWSLYFGVSYQVSS